MFQTRYNRDPAVLTGELNTGATKTEKAGYIPPKTQIENMILAGQKLDAWRKAMYDFKPGEDEKEEYDDPTRHPGFDLVDAYRVAIEAKKRIKASRLERQKADAENLQKLQKQEFDEAVRLEAAKQKIKEEK